MLRISRRGLMLGVAMAAALCALPAGAQDKEPIRVGVIYDFTGPFAAGGSEAGAVGTQIAIDLINERGGVEGHPIAATFADAQSKAEVAINEAERLWTQEDVDILMGVYSSAHCVPLAQRADGLQKFFWANICIASSVFKDKNLKYAFRAQVHSDQYGEASAKFLAESAEEKLGIAPEDLKVAIIYEDGPYGTGVAESNQHWADEFGFDVVLREGYAATAPDLSSLITKLRRARADVILHTGYNPDITLFLRQAREQGLRWKALIGHGAGYAQFDKLHATFGDDANYIYNVDPVAGQLLDPAKLEPGLGELIEEMVRRYKEKTGAEQVPPHVSSGFNQTWVLFDDVVPRAITEHGGFDAEALRQAALATDIPEGGTIQGYGVKFYPPEHEMAGQNERSFPVVMQYIGGDTEVVWPESVATAEPELPLPAESPYAAGS